MHKLKVKVLGCFKQEQSRPLSTSFLVEHIFSEELKQFTTVLTDSFTSKDAKQQALLGKAKYHRQLLHHLNMLVDDQILKVAGTEGKGEKIFAPVLETNQELIISDKRQKIVLSSSAIPIMPIEQYEQKKIVSRYAQNEWLQRLNAVMLEADRVKNLDELYKLISDILMHVNDVIALNDVEQLLLNNSIPEMLSFTERALADCKSYGIRLCLIVDATNIVTDEQLEQYLLMLTKTTNADHVTVVFEVTNREMLLHREFFERIISVYAKQNLKLNIKNDEVQQAPYIVGRAGPYTLSDKDWQLYLAEHQNSSLGICFTQSTVLLDVGAFFSQYKLASQFHDCMNAIARSLCIANSLQRKNQYEYFRHIIGNPKISAHSFFSVSNQCVRLLNYQQYLAKGNGTFDAASLLHLIAEAKQQTEQVAENQTIIFLSCGMPLRFHIGLAQAYRRGIDQTSINDNHWQSITITKAQDLYNKKMREQLLLQEQFKEVFTQGFELRCVREGRSTAQEVFSELSLLISSYKFPFICYKFSLLEEENLTLKQFMQ